MSNLTYIRFYHSVSTTQFANWVSEIVTKQFPTHEVKFEDDGVFVTPKKSSSSKDVCLEIEFWRSSRARFSARDDTGWRGWLTDTILDYVAYHHGGKLFHEGCGGRYEKPKVDVKFPTFYKYMEHTEGWLLKTNPRLFQNLLERCPKEFRY